MEEREQRARAFVQQILILGSEKFSPKGNEQFYHAKMVVEVIDVLVDLARVGEKWALQIVRDRMRPLYEKALAKGSMVVVPLSVNQLALEVLIYSEPHAKSGRKLTTSGQRNTTIAMLVKWVNEAYGFPIYNNVEHRGNPDAPMTALRLWLVTRSG